MNRQMLLFIAVAQSFLLLLHWLLYRSVAAFFPDLASPTLLWTAAVLAFSFLITTLLVTRFYNPLTRLLYILSVLWLPLMFYLLVGSALAALTVSVFGTAPETAAGAFYAAAILLLLYGVINARFHRVVSVNVKLKNLPESWKGKSAVVVSDLHLGHVLRRDYARRVVNKINSLKPDIVFIPGDFFDGVRVDFRHLAQPFKELRARHGAFFCSGNHEVYAGLRECREAIASAGITILDGKKVEIDGMQILATPYHFEALDDEENAIESKVVDYEEGIHRPARTQVESKESLKKALHKLGIDSAKPSIYLKHVPNHLHVAHEAGISLQLSGHTHHGQIYPFRYITRKVFQGFDYGLKHLGNFLVYTSSGVGTWGPPVRTFTRSEIVQIHFH